MEKPGTPYSKANLEEAKESIRSDVEGGGVSGYAQWLHIPADTFADFAGKRVLDLGAGKNLSLARDLEAANIHADVVSFSPGFAERGVRENIEGRKGTDKIVAGMGEQLPFADGSFDRVVCVGVFEFVETTERFIDILQEVGRVLAPGGIAYLGPIGDSMGEPGPTYIDIEDLEKILGGQIRADWRFHNTGDESGMLAIFTLVLEKKAHA